MEDRTVVEWNKDDLEDLGILKVDILGLGMLTCIKKAFDLCERHYPGQKLVKLDSGDTEDKRVYEMLHRADSIGVFQVESRAQIGTLPRLQPRSYYDLAIEIALIRPGPIQGGAVHPYIRRATGKEEVTYPHPVLKPVLERTQGVPLFQEQLMQMAIAIGDCTGDEADLLRRAMGSKRGIERIESLRTKLYEGMARHGLSEEESDAIYLKIQSFANFGFAESHALSFALLVYASSWIKCHEPAAFLAALLNSQPLGFYSASQLVQDARRHGALVRAVDVMYSDVESSLEDLPDTPAVRLGLHLVHGLRSASAERIVDMLAGEQMARRVMDVQRRRLTETRVLDLRTRRVLHDDVLPTLHTAILDLSGLARDHPSAREAIQALVVAQIGEHWLDNGEAAAIECPAFRCVDALLHPICV